MRAFVLGVLLLAPLAAASGWSASYDGRTNEVACVFGAAGSPCVPVASGANQSVTLRDLGFAGPAPARVEGAASWLAGPVAMDVFLIAERADGSFVDAAARHGMSPLSLAWNVPAGADDVRITVHAGVFVGSGATGVLVEPARDFHVDVSAS